LNYFRFFLGFFDAQYRVKPEKAPLVVLSVVLSTCSSFSCSWFSGVFRIYWLTWPDT
jgi:hypothetical protein